jgi:photosystem II stability/assembly factor-like uncharacterized protein
MSRCLSAAVLAVLLLSRAGGAEPAPDPVGCRIVDGLRARSIGPAVMGGRITDLAVNETDPRIFYVASASGGVWKTTDGGDTFTPIFDDQPALSIGAVALCQGKPDVIYVGTGEANPRNSVQAGAGVFKSTDGGKTWIHCGLKETHHIGRIAVHPMNPDVAYVAALGHVWGPNKERGLFKTTDGGKSWIHSHAIDENTGVIDVAMDLSNPDVLYCCGWQVRRDSFAGGTPFIGTGPKGGLFKSSDAGKTWEKLGGGLPERAYGRCGVAVSRKNPSTVLAVVQTDRTPTGPLGQSPRENDDPATGGVFKSTDAGKTWKKLNDLVPRPFYYGKIRIDPSHDQRIYVLGVTIFVSPDGGSTFVSRSPPGVHPDHHALWIDPNDPDHLILGNDGGLYVSKDRGRSFEMKRGLAIGQFYGIATDSRSPYHVIGGLQDNGSWMGPVRTPFRDGIAATDWSRVAGADGFHCAVDPKDPFTVYVEGQFGGLMRVNLLGEHGPVPKVIRPVWNKSETPHRYNWNAPFFISPHNHRTLYLGCQHVFKSTDRGDSWSKISGDLSRSPVGFPVTNFGHTISTLAESPVKPGVLWAGTDDGKVWLSKNDGADWEDLGRAVQSGSPFRWVSCIEPCCFDAAHAFLSLDRHRNDDFHPHIYSTSDSGATWKPITNGLPTGAVVCVLRQSSRNRKLLFAGTEQGLYVTLNGGERWHHVNKSGLPAAVRIDDLAIHPRERELVIGTHGRSLWVMDIAPLEQLTDAVLAADAHLFDVKPVTLLKPRNRRGEPPGGYTAPNPPPGICACFLTTEKGVENAELTCRTKDSREVGVVKGSGRAGLDSVIFDVTEPGEYTITLKAANGTITQTRTVMVRAE